MYTILAIDDDATTLGILQAELKALGYRVIAEKSPLKGVDLAKEFPPDVILLDLNMPQMTGFEVMQAMRKEKAAKDVPIVILTVNKDKETAINALKSGAVDYILKPHDPNILNMKIKSAIHQGIIKREQNIDECIEISHKGEMVLITIRGKIDLDEFRDSLKKLFTPFFIKSTRGKICIFDIRETENISDDDVQKIVKILSLFSEAKIKIVAGRHYGEIVSSADINEDVELFLSYGDLVQALNRQ